MALTEQKSQDLTEKEESKIKYRYVPRYSAWKEEDKLIFEIILPGVHKEDIHLKILDEYLSLHAYREETEFVLRRYLPFKVYPGKTTSKYDQGLLRIELFEHSPWDDAIEIKIE